MTRAWSIALMTLALTLPVRAQVKSVPVVQPGVGSGAAGGSLLARPSGIGSTLSGPGIGSVSLGSTLPDMRGIAPTASAGAVQAQAVGEPVTASAETPAQTWSVRETIAQTRYAPLSAPALKTRAESIRLRAPAAQERARRPDARTELSAKGTVESLAAKAASEDRLEVRTALGSFDGSVRRADGAFTPVSALMESAAGRPSGLEKPGVSPRKAPALIEKALLLTDDSEKAYPGPWYKRYGLLAALLAGLSALPSLLSAAPAVSVLQTMSAANAGGLFTLFLPSLGFFPGWPLLVLSAAALGVLGIPVRIFAYRLSPWSMKVKKSDSDKLFKKHPAFVVPMLALGAALEEFSFRGFFLTAGLVLLAPHLPLILLFPAAALASSILFSVIHLYGAVWTRVVGGLFYCAAFALSGTLFFPILMHLFFNLSLYIHQLYKKRTGRA